jgi:hypothetical protein
MKKNLRLIVTILTLWVNNNCNAQKNDLSGFVPEGFVLFDKIYGDLKKDGMEDCILIIKGTDKNNIIKDEYHGDLECNRRGLIVLFNKSDNYELVVKNYDCFSSENVDGGVYSPPELSISIEKWLLEVYIQISKF